MRQAMLLERTLEGRSLDAGTRDPYDVLLEALRGTSDVFDLARVAVILRDAAGQVLFTNWSAERLQGSDFPEQRVLRRTPGRRPARLAAILRRIASRLYDLLGDPLPASAPRFDGACRLEIAVSTGPVGLGDSSPALLEIMVRPDSDVRLLRLIDRF
jgi:hypothetical protein